MTGVSEYETKSIMTRFAKGENKEMLQNHTLQGVDSAMMNNERSNEVRQYFVKRENHVEVRHL